MSDNQNLDEIMKSLTITPNETARQKAKEAFLQKAEEVHKMDDMQPESKAKTKSFPKRKQLILTFVAGMAAAILMFTGINAAINPTFLTGTLISHSQVVRYRMFPSQGNIPKIGSVDKYLSEVIILYTPDHEWAVNNDYSLCDGRQLSLSSESTLFSAIRGAYGYDYSAFKFSLPDYSQTEPASDLDYYTVQSGSYPFSDGKTIKTADDIAYVAEDVTDFSNEYGYSVLCGEVELIKASDKASLQKLFLPCEGQTLLAKDYPVLASIIAPFQKEFTLPDLKGKSPIDGAEYYIAYSGLYTYVSTVVIPEGYVRCPNCHEVVLDTYFCMNCKEKLKDF
jgi:microcystin-dependent protein